VKYTVRIGEHVHEVEVDGGHVRFDGIELEADLAALPGTPLYHLLLGGESWTVAAQPLDGVGRWALGVMGERVEVEVLDERTRAVQPLAGTGRTPIVGATMRAPMPGLVVRVHAAPGQRVEAGAGLVVVEAMKMENELRAPHAGAVETVHVAVGQTVEKGAPLVTLASPERQSDAAPPSATTP
jgi:biotin carboxyl carrier protein